MHPQSFNILAISKFLQRIKVLWFKALITLTSNPYKVAQYWRKLGLIVGENTCVYHNVVISGDGREPVTIGSNCVLTGCTILAHDASANFHLGQKYGDPSITLPVTIEDNCFIGYGSIILMGVTIGHDSVVGAGAIVTKNVPPRSVVAGNPARVICSIDEFVEKRRKRITEYSDKKIEEY